MKYLDNYIEQAQTDLFNKAGAFFAFSTDQFNEQKQEGVEYFLVLSGMFCPKDTTEELLEGLKVIRETGIAQDLAENGKAAIMQRELANHEAQFDYDSDHIMKKLAGYGITVDELNDAYKIYWQHCLDNDLF